jgi:hypothetical protein
MMRYLAKLTHRYGRPARWVMLDAPHELAARSRLEALTSIYPYTIAEFRRWRDDSERRTNDTARARDRRVDRSA